MMVAVLVRKAQAYGARFELDGGRLFVRAPARLPEHLMVRIRERKAELIQYLTSEGHNECLSVVTPKEDELQEIIRRIEEDGYVLLWSTVLEDLIAFHRTEIDRKKIPPGFVPYSDAELQELFGEQSEKVSLSRLRNIHEKKKNHSTHGISNESEPEVGREY